MYSSISKTTVSWSNHGLSVIRRNSLLPHPYGGSVTLNACQLLGCASQLLGPTYAPPRCGLSCPELRASCALLPQRGGVNRPRRVVQHRHVSKHEAPGASSI